MNFDPVEFGKQIGGLIKEAVAPLLERIKSLESRQLEKGDKGDIGPAGKDADPVSIDEVVAKLAGQIDLKSLVDAAIAKHFEAHPVKNGIDGKDAPAPALPDVINGILERIDVKELFVADIAGGVKSYFEAHPVKNGIDGKDGADAEPIDIAEVANEILESDAFKMITGLQLSKAVDVHFQNHPVQHGKDGLPGEKGLPGDRGEKGDAGENGVGLAGAMIDRDNKLIVTTTKGERIDLGEVVGRDGKDGLAGRDGLSMSEVSRTYDADTHEVVERWAVADEKKELRYPAGGLRPGGFYRDGMKALALQVVTHDGCAWVALKETKAKPCHENKDDWQLLVRKGRDGDSYREKKEPEPVRLKADA